MGRFKSSSKPGPDSETLACSDEYPPFDSLIERNPSTKRREVYARYKPLSGLVHIPIPGTFHWAVEVISAEELAKEESGCIHLGLGAKKRQDNDKRELVDRSGEDKKGAPRVYEVNR